MKTILESTDELIEELYLNPIKQTFQASADWMFSKLNDVAAGKELIKEYVRGEIVKDRTQIVSDVSKTLAISKDKASELMTAMISNDTSTIKEIIKGTNAGQVEHVKETIIKTVQLPPEIKERVVEKTTTVVDWLNKHAADIPPLMIVLAFVELLILLALGTKVFKKIAN